jgi:hypothetical protein
MYPDLTAEELAEVESNLVTYLKTVTRIFDRIKNEASSSPNFSGTLSCTTPESGSSEKVSPK